MKVLALIQNETIKQLKKVSVIVMVILLVVASIGLPVLQFVAQQIQANEDQWYANDIEFYGQPQDEQLEGLTEPQKKAAEEARLLRLQEATLRQEQKIGYSYSDDWRTNLLEEWQNAMGAALVQKLLLDGMSPSDIETGVTRYIGYDSSYAELPKEELQASYEASRKLAEGKYQAIIKNDYINYLKTERLSQAREMVGQIEQEMALAPEEEKKEFQTALAAQKAELFAIEYRIEHRVMYDTSDWRHNTLLAIYNQTVPANTPLMTQSEFQKNSDSPYKDYQDYLTKTKRMIQDAKDEIQLCNYSLENNIPVMKYQSGSTRSILSFGLVFSMVVMVIAIMMGGAIMSSEYSKGTIRLLMLRPVSRWKILLSKYLCLLIFSVAAMLASMFVQTVTASFLFGVNDLFQPVISCSGGAIHSVNFFVWYLLGALYSFINVVFAISLAVALSTIFRNTAFAVGLTIFATLSGFIVTLVGAQMSELLAAIMPYTIFPYFNMGTFYTHGVIEMLYQEIGSMMNFTPDPVFGAWLLLGLSALFTVVTFVIYQKRDVKN